MAKVFLLKSPKISQKNLLWFPLFLIIYSFTGNISNDIYMPSMPALVHEFATTQSLIQLTLTMWFLGTALPQLLLGPISDRFGRRPVLFLGGLIFLFSTAICSITQHIFILIIARFFQGVGVCSLTIVSMAVICELFKDKKSVQLLSLLNICNAIAPLLGPLIGGYIFLLFGWRFNFYIVFVLAFIGLIGLWQFMPESKIAIDKEALKLKPFLNNYKKLLNHPFFLYQVLTYGLFFGGIIAYLTGAPFIIIEKLKIAPQYFGFTQLAVFCAFFSSAIMVARLIDKYGCKKIIILGATITGFGAFAMLITGYIFPTNLYLFVGTMMLYALGFGFSGAPLVKESLAVAANSGGSAAAMLGFSMTSLGSLGSLLVSLIYDGTIISTAIIIFTMGLLGLLMLIKAFAQ